MVAIQLELRKQDRAQQVMPDKYVAFEHEQMRLQQENVQLQEENIRLRQEIDDLKQAYAELDRRHHMAYFQIYRLRERQDSKSFLSQAMVVICALAVVFLLISYGTGFIESPSFNSSVEYNQVDFSRNGR